MRATSSKILLLSLAFWLANLPVIASSFPGKGSEQTWVQACNICNQGVQLMQVRRFAEAIQYFEKAMELYSYDPIFSYDAGVAHQGNSYFVASAAEKKAELAKAEYYFDMSTKLKADNFDVWIHMANVQSELQEYEKSLKSLETALALPGVPDAEKAKTQYAMAFVKAKLGAGSNSPLVVADKSQNSAVNAAVKTSESQSGSGWQSYGNASTPFVLRYPNGWQVKSDAKTGEIDVVHPSGASLTILPFAVAQTIDSGKAADLMNAMLKVVSPLDKWTKPQLAGPNTYKATALTSKCRAVAALLVSSYPVGSFGKLCVAKLPVDEKNIDGSVFAEMLGNLRFNSGEQTASFQALSQAASMQKNALAKMSSMSIEQQMAMMQQPQTWQTMSQSGLPPTPFAGFTTFVDPSEHSFEVDVPVGWKAEGGLSRISAIDCRPWVKVTSPDQLITAFVGDNTIPPFSVPTLLGTQLGYGVGRSYGNSQVRSYVPADKFVQAYAREKLGKLIPDLKVVDQHEHPDLAPRFNGTVAATRSDCASVKLTGTCKNIPSVAYFLAATKLTVQSGSGMWWVSYIAGVLGPADRDAGGLSVVNRMIATFHFDPNWQGQSLAATREVSRQFRQASQAREKSMMDSYWSQQAFNDHMHQAYWDRQATNDRAANNFSDYIRGTETVQDPQTGTEYKVQYGPQNHWIDPGGNVMGSNAGAPGPEWRQLMSVP